MVTARGDLMSPLPSWGSQPLSAVLFVVPVIYGVGVGEEVTPAFDMVNSSVLPSTPLSAPAFQIQKEAPVLPFPEYLECKIKYK